MRVYLSSTYKDLLEYRRAVYAAIHKAGFECSAMEDYAASDERPVDLCLNDVARCDLYVGIFAHRYGHVPKGHELSATEQECRKAEECGIPRLIFMVDEETPWLPKWIDEKRSKAGRKLKQLKDELGKFLTVDRFQTPDELATKVLAALQKAVPKKDTATAESSRESDLLAESRPGEHRRIRAPAFTGRAVELQELELTIRKRLTEGGALGFWGLRGTGGIGKSALAAELAERLWNDAALFPGGVLWTNLLEETPAVAAARWLRTYGVDVHEATPAECLYRFHQLACKKLPLIVLDNAQRKDDVKALLVNTPGVVVLVTTRELENFPPEVQPFPVDVLHPDDALSLLGTFAPAGVATEPDAAKLICEQCGYFPLFLRVAGSALRTGEFPLVRDYAAELARRGLARLADHDREAIKIFDISWDKLADAIDRDVFTACALFPGESFGENFVRAWTGMPLNEARRCLIRLENSSLLLTTDGRFRFHDRVRDYAASRLEKPVAQMMPQLVACWTNWEFVESELEQVKAYELSWEYHQLQGLPGQKPAEFLPWAHFVQGQTHVLAQWPELFFQHAFNEPVESPVSRAAQQRTQTGDCPSNWLEWINRPQEWAPPACLRILEGHSSGVRSMALSVDGRRAVSGSFDKTVRVWDLETGDCLRTLQGHSSYISSVALSVDGRRAVSGSGDNTVRVWDVETGDCLRTLQGHTQSVESVALSVDGRRAISGSEDRTVRVWDLETGDCLRTLQEHTSYVSSVALSVDGRRAVSGSFDKTVRVWDLETGDCLRMLQGHSSYISSVALSVDGRRAVSGSWDNTVRVWDVETGDCLRTLQGHTQSVESVALSVDGHRAVSGSEDQTVRVWDVKTGDCLRTLQGHTSYISSVALSVDGRRVVSGSWDNTVRVWDVETGDSVRTPQGHTSHVSSVALSVWGRRAVSGSWDNTVRVWNLETGDCLRILQGHTSYVSSVALSVDGRRAVSGSWDNTVRVWNLETGDCLCTLQGHTQSVESVALSVDGRRAVSGGWDNTVRVWDVETGDCLRTLQGHTQSVMSVALSVDGRSAVSGSEDQTVRVWDLETGDCLRTLQGHTSYIISVALSVDGRRAVSGGGDNTVRVWDPETGDCLEVHPAHTRAAGVAWSQVLGMTVAYPFSRSFSLCDAADEDFDLRFAGDFHAMECSYGGESAIAGTGNGDIYILHLRDRIGFQGTSHKA